MKFVGRGSPGFADGRRENADPAAFWPSTRRGRLRTVASPCQDRHVGGGGGLAGRRPPRRPLENLDSTVFAPFIDRYSPFSTVFAAARSARIVKPIGRSTVFGSRSVEKRRNRRKRSR